MSNTQLNNQWLSWIRQNWPGLEAGERIEAPRAFVPPSQCGFVAQPFASPEGQTADWTLSIGDQSRVHIHEFADGRRVVHRDKHDPDQGILSMLAHLTFETPYVAAGGLALLLVAGMKGK
jgi:hypothetical protein